jgi:hypothetical protein
VTVQLEKINDLSRSTGLSTSVVRAIIGLSKPVRASVRMTLLQTKQNLQGRLSTVAFKANLVNRKKEETFKLYGQVQEKSSQVKRVLSMLQIGPDFYDNTAFKDLIGLLLGNVKVPGVTLGGYRDMDNILDSLNFNAQQILKAADIAQLTVSVINDKIDEIDRYIDILDAVDNL